MLSLKCMLSAFFIITRKYCILKTIDEIENLA